MMRTSSLLVVFLLALHLLLCGAYGVRLGKFGVKSTKTQHTKSENNNGVKKNGDNNVDKEKLEVVCKDEDHCLSKGITLLKRSRDRSSVAKESDHHDYHHHHWFPWIHEDYYGPKRHIPKHH